MTQSTSPLHIALASLAAGIVGCGQAPPSVELTRTEGAVRNGSVVTPFGPNAAPAETKAIVGFSLAGCTGTVVDPSWVLSAKHCSFNPGETVVSRRPTGNVTRTVDTVVMHTRSDVVMLHMSTPLSDVPIPAPFWGVTADIVGQTVNVYGYGAKAATSNACSATVACPTGQWCHTDSGVCFTPSDELRTAAVTATASVVGEFKTPTNAMVQQTLPGDSGGPTFLAGRLAGVNAWWSYDLSGSGQVSFPTIRSWMYRLVSASDDDIVWHNGTSGATQLWHMSGLSRTSFTNLSSTLDLPDSSGWTPIANADFNKDGKADLIWHNGTTGVTQAWYMDGATRLAASNFDSSLNVDDTTGWRFVGSADVNRDGGPDLIAHNGLTGETQVWYMNGIARTSAESLSATLNVADSTGWRIIGMADFDQDGAPDIFWHNGTSGESQVWYMDGAVRISAAALSATLNVNDASGWRLISIADYNHDGKPDVLARNESAGTLQIWFMDNISRTSVSNLDSSLNVPASTGWRVVSH
jgi:hypothetical protein